MRIPHFERYTKGLVGTGLFVVGVIVGCALFMSMYQHNFSLLSIENQHLRTEIANLTNTNKSLNLSKNKQSVISKITILFEKKNEPTDKNSTSGLDDVTEIELRKAIVQDLQFLIGKPTNPIKEDPLLYLNLIHRKIYPAIHERDYMINVRTMLVVQSEFILYINVSPVRR